MIVLFGVMALLFASIGSLLLVQGLLVFFGGFSGGGMIGLIEVCFAPLPF